MGLAGDQVVQADLPAPDGPIIKIFNVGKDSSDAMVFGLSAMCLFESQKMVARELGQSVKDSRVVARLS